MGQYRLEHKAPEYPELARHLKRDKNKEALKLAKKNGIARLVR